MLGHHFRLRVSNTQNQAITVALKYRPWKFSSAGALVYGAEQTLQLRNSADTAFVAQPLSLAATVGTTYSTTVDNSIDLYIGAEFTLSGTAGATTNGSGVLSVTLERSTDAGTTWPKDGQGEFVGGYTVTAADTTSARLKNLTVD